MRNRNLNIRRNVRNNKKSLVESIMTKIRPIVENAVSDEDEMEFNTHFWANPIDNADALKKFENEKSDACRCVIGLQTILENHNQDSKVVFSVDNGELYASNLTLNVPTVSDLQMLSDDLKGDIEIMHTFNCVSYFPMPKYEPTKELYDLIESLEKYGVEIKED